jgi:hypothetical protein
MEITPYNTSEPITKSDTVNFVRVPSDAIYVGGAGTVTVVWMNDRTEQFTCVAGQILPVRVKRVNSTGTAATLMVALYQI